MTNQTTAAQTEEAPIVVTEDMLTDWATKMDGPVALHMKQKLVPVEGEGGVIFPATYADIGYNIDTLSDGSKVVSIDSVGSQANRMEPIFRASENDPQKWLVPQIMIKFGDRPCGKCEECKSKKKCKTPVVELRSLLELAHRSADAVVQSSPSLAHHINDAFEDLRGTGNAGKLCKWAPTSLVFGVWDSRGGTGEKRPRLIRSMIRAWDVEPLHSAAQFTSVWKSLDEVTKNALKEEEAKKNKKALSDVGLADAPAVFRKNDKIPKYRDGVLNSEARVLGGVLVRGRIEREVTVNLVALRGIRGVGDTNTVEIRKYLLGLTLVAATAEMDLFLREGCHLRFAEQTDVWFAVPRRGEPKKVALGTPEARTLVQSYASTAADPFRKEWPKTQEELVHTFDVKKARELLAKKDNDATEQG